MKKNFKVKSKNRKLLEEFIDYCIEHPEERFWQALRNWSGFNYIYANKDTRINDAGQDTFYFKEKER